MPATNETPLKRAKAMRSEMTQPEREMWIAPRAKPCEGVKFSRQVAIGPFIADFVARSHKFIVEVDGDTHADPAHDRKRTEWLEEQGYRVIRFNNDDVMRNLEGVLQTISVALATAPLPTSFAMLRGRSCPRHELMTAGGSHPPAALQNSPKGGGL